jgi:hypothetical protein
MQPMPISDYYVAVDYLCDKLPTAAVAKAKAAFVAPEIAKLLRAILATNIAPCPASGFARGNSVHLNIRLGDDIYALRIEHLSR